MNTVVAAMMCVVGSFIKRNGILAITVAACVCLSSLRTVSGQSCAAASCSECLNTITCVWFSESSECLETCSSVTDEPCYSNQNDESESLDAICTRADTEFADWTTCRLANDCTACVSILQSDGVTPCSWYGTFCGSGLTTFQGSGSTTCEDGPVPAPTTDAAPTAPAAAPTSFCNLDATSCEECLLTTDNNTEVPYNCAWSVDQCLDSCKEVVGFPCYSFSTYPELISTPEEICKQDEFLATDDNLCMEGKICTSCVDIVQKDGSTRCLWFESDDNTKTPYCGAHNSSLSVAKVDEMGCDFNGVCGTSDCSVLNVPVAPVAVGSPTAPRSTPTTSSPTSGTGGNANAWRQIVAATSMASIYFVWMVSLALAN